MIKKGVYCSRNKKEVKEKHGGATLKDEYYDHICFFIPEKLVGFYGGSRMWLNPFLQKKFRYKGELNEIQDEEVKFYIDDPYNHDKLLFQGRLTENGLLIKATRLSDPNKIWLEDVFEYIGTGGDQV
jgi:hypothetical protein